MIPLFDVNKIDITPYLFFTGKGGVGKASTACATAISLADRGKKVLLVSTDPASNLQDVFNTQLDMHYKETPEVQNLFVANLDPDQVAQEYRENVVGPYRGKLPDVVIQQMEEQLSGSCTVEIASFNEFSTLLTDKKIQAEFDHIVFDTAPTGHTLRLLQLPNAWNQFIEDSTEGTTSMGLLAGLNERKDVYEQTVKVLSNPKQTSLVLVTRADTAPLEEAARASKELAETGIRNQILIINGLLNHPMLSDDTAAAFASRQETALNSIPEVLKSLPTWAVPLVPFNITGVRNVRKLFDETQMIPDHTSELNDVNYPHLTTILDDIMERNQRVVFTMGKGGVGKTTVASAIAVGLVERGKKVHLTTTDPAAHLDYVMHEDIKSLISMSKIDQKEEHKEIANSSGEAPVSVQNLLPRLRNEQETSIVIVTLAETTPVYEAERLSVDLQCAGITPKWWVVNQSMIMTHTQDPILHTRALGEQPWIQRVNDTSNGKFAVIPMQNQEIIGY
ncbi:TRC40/GET3/ArsA family transport-energizing ATPase [Paenibacillus sp. FSL L8-0709]|uniref:TRC40/GET3/ArsA family transport-energizing ATPase n=1 Tax=Paenibacillus sp. FSL L8-0709 TaxID=2975312 RepID=UPI0030FCF447